EFFVEVEDGNQQPPTDVLLLGALGQFPLAELHHQVDRSLGLGKIALGAAPLPSFGFERFLSFPFLFGGLLVRLLGRFLLLGTLVVGSLGLQWRGGDETRGDREADGAKEQKQEGRRNERRMPAAPFPRSLDQAGALRQDWLVVEESLQVVGKFLGAAVA